MRTILILFVMQLSACLYGEDKTTPEIELKNSDRKFTFEFVETPLNEALAFFVSLTKQNIILDPDTATNTKNISLKVTILPFNEALKKVLDTAELETLAGADAIYIFKKGSKPRNFIAPFKPAAEWEKEFCKKLERKISFEFVDTPLVEAVSFLKSLLKANIIVDPVIDVDQHPPVTLRLSEIEAGSAILWVLRLTNSNYVLRDEALFVVKNGAYTQEPAPPLAIEQNESFVKAEAQLSNDDFTIRQTASAEIERLGVSAEPLIAAAIKNSKDAEVAARLRNILSNFPRLNPFIESPEVTQLLESAPFTKKLSFEFVDTPLSEGLGFVVSMVKQNISYDKDANATFSMRLTDVQAANAIRWIARLTNRELSVVNGVLTVGPARSNKDNEVKRERFILVK